MSLYVTLPHLDVQRANAFAGAGILSLTPLLAAKMMGEAFAFHFDLKVNGVMLIHHDAYLMAEQDLEQANSKKYHLLKFRGGTLFNKMDVNSKNRSGESAQPVNSDQPNAFMSGQWSLVLDVDDTQGLAPEELEHDAQSFLDSGTRLAGGIVQSFGKPCAGQKLFYTEGPLKERGVINRSIGNGFVVVDRSEHLRSDDASRVDRLLSVIATNSLDEGQTKGWFSPAVVGYAVLSPLEEKENVREDKLHAFCESIIGLTQLMSIRKLVDGELLDLKNLFWKHEWQTSDVFILSQAERY